ncbi:MAG: hypothetical protein QNJ51_09090 [Calothrix sp. MO_167.B12]|nr:hypothetical protein [Calothrix sp. MO_167.B12]
MSFISNTTVRSQPSCLDKWRKCIRCLSETELKLYLMESNEVTLEIIQERQCLSALRVELENHLMAIIALGLNHLNDELNQGIKELNAAIKEINNAVNILKGINKVTNIIKQILDFVIPG